MISFERKSGEKGILGQIKSRKSLIALIALSRKSCLKSFEALSLMASFDFLLSTFDYFTHTHTHTHTQFSHFSRKSAYMKDFAITD